MAKRVGIGSGYYCQQAIYIYRYMAWACAFASDLALVAVHSVKLHIHDYMFTCLYGLVLPH